MHRFIVALVSVILGACAASAQQPPFVQDTWTWCSSAIPNGTFHRLTTITTDPDYLPFPDWVPQQFYITYARAMHSVPPAASPGLNGQYTVGVDRGGISYATSGASNHDGQTGNNTRWFPLANVFLNSSDPMERTNMWNPPVFFQQGVDILWFQLNVSGMAASFSEQGCFEIGILELGPGVAPVAIPPTQQ